MYWHPPERYGHVGFPVVLLLPFRGLPVVTHPVVALVPPPTAPTEHALTPCVSRDTVCQTGGSVKVSV